MAEEKKKLTTFAELTTKKPTTIIETDSGYVFEVERMDPGDLIILLGTPLLKELVFGADKGKEITASELIRQQETGERKRPEDITANRLLEIVSDEDFMTQVKMTIITSVASVNFANKPQSECDEATEEVSLSNLAMKDMIQIYMGIIAFSMPGEDKKDFYSFRGENGEESSDDGADTPDSEGIREETIGDAISSPEESPVDAGN